MEGARSSLNGSVATAILTLLQYHDCRIADDCFKLVPFFSCSGIDVFSVFWNVIFLFEFYDFKVRFSTPSCV